MKIKHWTDVLPADVPDHPGATIRWILDDKDNAPHFAMRIIELQAGRCTPHHSHWWEHEVFVLAGHGVVITDAGETPISEGSTILVEGNEMHQFRSTDDDVLRFICLIPNMWLEGLAEKYAKA